MRFETSQTTPSYLDRRLQLRMLSCVGVISIVMITLSLSRTRPPTQSADSRNAAVAAANLALADVPVEHRVLKPDEVIILPGNGHQGPRGQWADDPAEDDSSEGGTHPTDRPPADLAEGDLFQPRDRERSSSSPLFERRNGTTIKRDTPQPPADSSWEAAKGSAPKQGPDRSTPLDRKPTRWHEHSKSPAAPLGESVRDESPQDNPVREENLFDRDFTSAPISTRGDEGLDQEQVVPPRSKPLLDDPVSPDKSDLSDDPVFDDTVPSRRDQPKHNRPREDDHSPIGDGDLFDLTSRDRGNQAFDLTPAPGLAHPTRKRERPADKLDSLDDAAESDAGATPIDLRRREDRWLDDDSRELDRETVRGDATTVKINKQYLDVVQDNTMGIRRVEAKPYYWLLDRTRRIAASRFERAGRRDVQYINLMTEPDRFRGDPITIEGDLWRLYEYETSHNDYGVERVYEGWVFTGDSANHPYRVVFTSLPKGIEPGENLRKPVRLTGYFFKREGYQSNGGVSFAPTLLARRMTINPMPNGIPLTSGIVPYMIVVIMAVGLALLVTTVGFAISDERSTRSGRQRRAVHSEFSFADLAVPSPVSVEESLRQFAERERQTAVSGAYGPLLSRQAAREHAVHDYSTSKQVAASGQRRHHERQNGILQDWSSRQKAALAEKDQLRETSARPMRASFLNDDDLESDGLAQARHRVPRGNPPTRTAQQQSPIVISPSTEFPVPSATSKTIAHPLSSVDAGKHRAGIQPPRAETPQASMAQIPTATNISYGASKLSEWEEEVSKLANRSTSRAEANLLGTITVTEPSPAAHTEQDRFAHERLIRERIQRQQEDAERERLQREQFEHERQLRDQQEQERHERLRIERERLERERYEQEQERVERERIEFERAERERLQREQSEHERQLRDQQERERHERLRIERERLERERYEQERVERERTQLHRDDVPLTPELDEAFDSSEIADSVEPQTDDDRIGEPRKRRGGGWGWPRRRKSSEQSADGSKSASDEPAPESEESPPSSSGWGRRRKHRRNWRNDDSSSS